MFSTLPKTNLRFLGTMDQSKNRLFDKEFTLTEQSTVLKALKNNFQNIVGKGENAGNLHFLLFPQCFNPIKKVNHHFRNIYFVVCTCENTP